MRIALANLEFPESPQASVAAAEAAIAQAADAGASLICAWQGRHHTGIPGASRSGCQPGQDLSLSRSRGWSVTYPSGG